MKNILHLSLLFILLPLFCLSQNPIKGAGISYFDTPPSSWENPNEQFSSEMAFNVITKQFYYWDRTVSEWIPFSPDDDVTAFYINGNDLCLYENGELCIPLSSLGEGTNVSLGNGNPLVTGNENEGDIYTDLSTGTIYVFDGDSWILTGNSNPSSITSVINIDDSITHTHNDGEGNITTFTTNNGNTSSLTNVTNPNGSITYTHNDGEGNINTFITNDGNIPIIISTTDTDNTTTYTYTDSDPTTDDVSWQIINHQGKLEISGYTIDSSQVILKHEKSDGTSESVNIDFPCKDVIFTDFLGNNRRFSDCEGILLDRDLMIQNLSTEGIINQSITTPFADVVQFGNALTDVSTYSNVLALATSSATNSGNYSIVSGYNPENIADANFTTGSNCISSAKNAITFGGSTENSGQSSIAGGIKSINHGLSSVVVGDSLYNDASNNIVSGARNEVTAPNVMGSGSDNICSGGNSVFWGLNNTITSFSSIAAGRNRINNAASSFSGGTSSGDFMIIPATHSTAENSLSYGLNTQTKGENSVSLGSGTIASSLNQVVLGQFNESTGLQNLSELDPTDHVFVIGNGAGTDERRNAFAIRKDGIVQQYVFAGIVGSSVPSTSIAINILNTATSTDPNLFVGAITVIQVTNRTMKPGSGPEEFIYNASQSTWELR